MRGARLDRRYLALGLAMALSSAAGRAADVTPSLTADRTDLRLSDSMHLTLAVEGPGPLRVELPAELLDAVAAANWRLRPAGAAAVTDLPGGRQRWSQSYRADPYVAGDKSLKEWVQGYASVAIHFFSRTRWFRIGTMID